jgi:hypothetical protein
MSNDFKDRVPPIPNWRWILLYGEEEQKTEELLQLQRYIEEEEIDITVDEESDFFKAALKIRDNFHVRKTLEKLLAERCSYRKTKDIIFHKYKVSISGYDIKMYRNLFFDTENLSNLDIARYYEDDPLNCPIPQDAPPVPGKWREAYMIHKEGGDAEIDIDDAVKFMFVDSMFRAAELSEYGWKGDSKKLKYQKMALDAYKTLTDAKKDGRVDLPSEFNTEIWYPESTSVNHDEIDYDPEDDPNEEGNNDE